MPDLNIRNVPEDLARQAKIVAYQSNESLREWCIRVLSKEAGISAENHARIEGKSEKSASLPKAKAPKSKASKRQKTSAKSGVKLCRHRLAHHPGCEDFK